MRSTCKSARLIDAATFLETARSARRRHAASGLRIFALAAICLVAQQAFADKPLSHRSSAETALRTSQPNNRMRAFGEKSQGMSELRYGDERDFESLPKTDDY